MKVNGSINYYSLFKEDRIFFMVSYGLTKVTEDMYSWNELYFFKDKYKKIDIDIIKDAINSDANKQTDEKIINGFVWNGNPVWLSSENQFNFKAAYDMAIQTNGVSLPVKFKIGETPITYVNKGTEEAPEWVKEGGDPIYHTFETVEDITDFFTKAFAYINQCLDEGWELKDSVDYDAIEEELDKMNNDSLSE